MEDWHLFWGFLFFLIVVLSYLVYLATPEKDREKALARIVCTKKIKFHFILLIAIFNILMKSYFLASQLCC